jgi:acyl carrier protein phosphodiesterase
MNYLAHIYLARHSELAMIGALMGDFARPAPTMHPILIQEIILHRRIDAFTDSHPAVQQLLTSYETPRRRFAGIFVDIFFDHALSRRWRSFSDTPLDQFIGDFYRALSDHAELLPPPMRAASQLMMAEDWLGSYADPAGVKAVVERVSRRLSRGGQHLRDCNRDMAERDASLMAGFDHFFPELLDFVAEQRNASTE